MARRNENGEIVGNTASENETENPLENTVLYEKTLSEGEAGGSGIVVPSPENDEKTVYFGKDGKQQTEKLTVGWLVVWDGPGRGNSYPISSGRNSIGRGSSCDIQLPHGDKGISRNGVVSIIYYDEDNSFLLQDQGATRPVTLDGKPVLQPAGLKDGDIFKLGATQLIFVPFCKADRTWA